MPGQFTRSNTKSAKLRPQDVLDIRNRYAGGATQGTLARDYQMSVGTIGRIVRGESWNAFAQVPTDRAIQTEAAHEAYAAGEFPGLVPPAGGNETDHQASMQRVMERLNPLQRGEDLLGLIEPAGVPPGTTPNPASTPSPSEEESFLEETSK